jgi:hypothetical protein
MNYIGLILNLADNLVELYKDERANRHRTALFELRRRYEKEQAKDQVDFNIVDSIELDIMLYVQLLNTEITKKKTSDL